MEKFRDIISKKDIINFSQRLASNVFKERNLETDEQLVFKFEKVNHIHLITEAIILFDLNKIERISKIVLVGIEGSYKILVMKYIGPSLKYYFRRCNRKFTLPTTLKISQVLNILQQIHDKSIVLRYLKPENMLIGSGENKDYLYLIDFDLAKNYIIEGNHILMVKVMIF